ncbi:MAG: protein TonB [Planctomycetota bacterium]|jgi:protein TonB|uniref:energy transducer TonB n=1 Tax=Patiriisocius sp. Uisw_047 TaxID=3230969 RepID=UPI0039EB3166
MKLVTKKQTDNLHEKRSKREDKKKTNIKFNSAIFFQLGLVVALVAAAWAMNLNIGERTIPSDRDHRVTITEPIFDLFTVEPNVAPVKTIAKLTPPPIQRPVTSQFTPVDDDKVIKETKLVDVITAPYIPVTPVIAPPVIDPPEDNSPKSINSVEFVPIFPGCESAGNNAAKRACMSEKIGQFVGRKFDPSVADYGTTGTQTITVQFKIDKNGNVVDIIARAPDKSLEKEAQRVVSRLPEFTPGKMGDVPVDVMYMLPIKFSVD